MFLQPAPTQEIAQDPPAHVQTQSVQTTQETPYVDVVVYILQVAQSSTEILNESAPIPSSFEVHAQATLLLRSRSPYPLCHGEKGSSGKCIAFLLSRLHLTRTRCSMQRP